MALAVPKACGANCIFIIVIVFGTFLITHCQNDAGGASDSGSGKAGGGTYRAPYITMDQFRKQLLYPTPPKDRLVRMNAQSTLHDEALGFRLPFFGFEYRYIWLHLDGYFLFNYGLAERNPGKVVFPTPHLKSTDQDPSIIAPWFSKQNILSLATGEGAGVYFRVVNLAVIDRPDFRQEEVMLRERLKIDFREGMSGAINFVPKYAIIATWRNVTFSNRRADSLPKSNTYQAIIATDEKRTYAMFNYQHITWISHEDNYEGMKGIAAFIGFNAGNRTRAFEYEPYSQQPRVSMLTSLGFGNGLKGRFFFQIDEEVWPGCCIERELDINYVTRPKLSFFPRYGSMLGGTMVNVTGPCILNERSIVKCKFDTLEVEGIRRDPNQVTCISPPLMYHGYIDLSISVDNGPFLFSAKYYIQPPDMAEADVTVLNGNDRLEAPQEFHLQWKYEKITWNSRAPVTLSLWGYREAGENYPQLTYIDTLTDESIQAGTEMYSLDLEPFANRWNGDKLNIYFGFIAVNLTNPEPHMGGRKISPVLWSSPMPLGWYFRHQWNRKYGRRWKQEICENWFVREKHSDRFAITLFRCPCTMAQANLDRGRFAPDLQCNEIDRKCETFHKAAKHCVRSGRAAVGGAGQLCCYDDHGELIRTGDTMYGGRPSRAFQFGKHPFKQRMMIPALSYWLHDVSPFFFCCKWADGEDDADTCDLFKYWRTSQDCSLYQPPGVASVFGDPHFVTFDRINYTFNGKGEFILTRVSHALHKLDVQGRFEQPMPIMIDDGTHLDVNGTRLMAVTAQDNISSIVEFRVRPEQARWQYHMYIIVDHEYVYFWDNSMRVQYFKGVTLFQPANVYNMSHIVAMFDSGAGIEVMVENGHMGVHVYLPLTFMNKTAGLLGRWSRDQDDEFTPPVGDAYLQPKSKTYDIHQKFGKEWRVSEVENDLVGKSLFFHNSISFAEFDNISFVPEFKNPPDIPDDFPFSKYEVSSICSDSRACLFDFIVTRDINFAVATRLHENYAQHLSSEVRKNVTRCPELAKPRNGRKTEVRYFVGTTVKFICREGYRLVGYENRRCRGTGLWSWGVDPMCISEADYARKVAGISAGIVLPLLIVGALACCCLCIRIRERQQTVHYTGEKGQYSHSILEMKSNLHRNGEPLKHSTPNETVLKVNTNSREEDV